MKYLSINFSCIACDACRDVCPTEAISVEEPVYKLDSNSCIMCNGYSNSPQCVAVCPVDAIALTESKITESNLCRI